MTRSLEGHADHEPGGPVDERCIVELVGVTEDALRANPSADEEPIVPAKQPVVVDVHADGGVRLVHPRSACLEFDVLARVRAAEPERNGKAPRRELVGIQPTFHLEARASEIVDGEVAEVAGQRERTGIAFSNSTETVSNGIPRGLTAKTLLRDAAAG